MFGHNYIVLLEKASVSQTMIELCHGCIITSKWYILIIIVKKIGHRTELQPLK